MTVKVPPVPTVKVALFPLVIAGAWLIVSVRLAEAVWAVGVAESVTVTVKVKAPLLVGVPESAPAELRLMPSGRDPDVIAQVYGAVPFVAVNVAPGYTVFMTTLANCPDVVVTVNVGLPPDDVQPAIQRVATIAQIPRI